MRHTDLELYRWKYHHDIYLPSIKSQKQRCNSYYQWWHEYGAFISMLPRQVGKTNMLISLANNFSESGEDYLFVAHNNRRAEGIKQQCGLVHVVGPGGIYEGCFNGILTTKVNLLVDEYNSIEKHIMIELLDRNWNTVSMAGTLR